MAHEFKEGYSVPPVYAQRCGECAYWCSGPFALSKLEAHRDEHRADRTEQSYERDWKGLKSFDQLKELIETYYVRKEP